MKNKESWETFKANFQKLWQKIRPLEDKTDADSDEVREEETTTRKRLHNLMIDVNDSCAWITVLLPYVFYFFAILITTGVLSHGLWHIRDVTAAGRDIDRGDGNVWEAFASLIFVFSIVFETIILSVIGYQYLSVYPERLKIFNEYLHENFVIVNPKMEKAFLKASLRRYFVYYQMHFAHHIENFDFEDIQERELLNA